MNQSLIKKLLLGLLIFTNSLTGAAQIAAPAKKYHRALIIAGGGIDTGVGLGMLAAAHDQGWDPDVVLTTCGASLSATVYNAYGTKSYEYIMTPEFFHLLSKTHLATTSLIPLGKAFDAAAKNMGTIPPVFTNYVLSYPTALNTHLPDLQFHANDRAITPHFVMIAAQSDITPKDVGQKYNGRKLFRETLFTDEEVGAELKNYKSAIGVSYPKSYVATAPLIVTDKSTEYAARASISDPFLINPPLLDGKYYFTGAVDLFPVEIAEMLADEVFVTYPVKLFTGYSDTAVEGTFGYTQTQRALQILNDHTVKWIDMYGVDATKFDPSPMLLKMENKIPTNLADFQAGMKAQYEFGYARMQEALRLQMNKAPNRSHLRMPINPALYKSFTCDRAIEWKTDKNPHCQSDNWPGCDRGDATTCTPIR